MPYTSRLTRIYNKIFDIARTDRTPVQTVFFAIMEFEGDVNNGGLEQFFLNRSGSYAPVMEAYFLEIGAPNCAKIARKAFEIVGGRTIDWGDQLSRKARILDISDEALSQLADLDVLFWDEPDPLEQLMKDFSEAHPAELDSRPVSAPWPRLRSVKGTIGATDGFRWQMSTQPNAESAMATNPEIPPPDTINPVAPPEIPVGPDPSEAPYNEPPGVEPPIPDNDQPDPGMPELPPPPD